MPRARGSRYNDHGACSLTYRSMPRRIPRPYDLEVSMINAIRGVLVAMTWAQQVSCSINQLNLLCPFSVKCQEYSCRMSFAAVQQLQARGGFGVRRRNGFRMISVYEEVEQAFSQKTS